jgi:hypothetical protein
VTNSKLYQCYLITTLVTPFSKSIIALIVLLFTILPHSHATSCAPTLQADLWSTLYGTNNLASVTIPSGKKITQCIFLSQLGKTVLLDVSTLTLNGGITIEDGGSLYFDWQRNISLSTNFILIKGSLFVGTEACPFENQVDILLTDDPTLEDMNLGAANVGRKVNISRAFLTKSALLLVLMGYLNFMELKEELAAGRDYRKLRKKEIPRFTWQTPCSSEIQQAGKLEIPWFFPLQTIHLTNLKK